MQKDKTRDMIRSILPSRAERMARFKKNRANRRNRVKVRQTLHQYNSEGWGEDSEEEMVMRIHESDCTRRRDIRWMKMERRQADKISHFVRWCEKKTAHISENQPQEKYSYISSLIGGPTSTVRKHALRHFMNPDYDFNVEARSSWKHHWRWPTEVDGSGQGLFDRAAFIKALRWAYENCPAQLNRALKGNQRSSFEPALLWRGCKTDDSCTKVYFTLDRRYTYQTTYGMIRTSWNKPLHYREGTLVSQKVERDHIDHDSSICRNKILVTCEEDIERITNKLFGNGKVYHKPSRYGYDRYGYDRLHGRLIPFLMAKGLLDEKKAE